MADSLDPPAAPVTNHTTPPQGGLPRRQIAAWAFGLGALVIVVFYGTARANKAAVGIVARPVAEASELPLNGERMQARVRTAKEQEQLARERIASALATPPPTYKEPPMLTRATGGSASASTPDPNEADRKKRDYESLFASNVVVSRRSGSEQPLGPVNDAKRSGPTRETSSLQDIADAVVSASQRGMPASAFPPGVPPSRPNTGRPDAPVPPQRTPPIDAGGEMNRILEGTIIDGVLTNRLDGSSKAPVNILVTNPLYSHAGDVVVIPAGSRVLGEAAAVQNFGESRIGVGFHRLIFPDGSTVRLDQFKGLNQAGDNGLKDQVNNHYASTFAAAAVTGVVTGIGQAVGNLGIGGTGNNRTTVIASGAGNSTSQATNQMLSKLGNRLPVITIREGSRVRIYMTSDLELPAYPESH